MDARYVSVGKWGMTLNYGDVPAWIASIGTVAAFSVALIQIRTERNLRQQADDQDRKERHRAQARLISAMPGPTEPEEGLGGWCRTGVYGGGV